MVLKKSFLKKGIALCLSVLMLASFINLSAFIKVKADSDTDMYSPEWFTKENDSKWWDGNSYNGLTGPDGGFLINRPDGKWQYYYRWGLLGGSGRLDCNGPGMELDTAKYEYLNYEVNASKDVDLYVQAYKIQNGATVDSSRTFIKVAELSGGDNAGSIKLTDNAQFKALVNSEGKIWINGPGFFTKKFVGGDTITVTSMGLSKNKHEYHEPDAVPSWITSATDTNWWSWDWNFEAGQDPERFTADYAESGGITVTWRGGFEDLKYMGDKLTVNLIQTPYLYCDITTEMSCDLYLLCSKGTEGNSGVLIEKGVKGNLKKKYKIKDILPNHVEGNTFQAYGFRLVTSEGSNLKTAIFKTMDFGTETSDFSADRPKKPEISLSTLNMVPSLDATITAPADAKRVQYRIGSSGEWLDYTAPITVTKNYQLFARYISADNRWSMVEGRKITNIKAEVSGDVEPVIPIWYTKGIEDSCWYNWDWHHNKNDEGRFFITYPDDIWTTEIGKDWCTRLETQHNDSKYHVQIDLDEQTNAFYKINSQFDAKVWLKVKNGSSNSNYASVEIGSIPAGKSADSFDISGNSELLSLSDDNNKLTVSGMYFTYGANVGQTISVERFLFDAEDAFYEGYPGEITAVKEIIPNWFIASNVNKWTTSQQIINTSNVGGSVLINEDNDWTYTVLDPALAVELTSGGDSIKTNLNSANHVFYKIRSDFEGKMQLCVKFKGKINYIDIGTITAGKNFKSIDLTGVKALEGVSTNGTLTVTGVRFIPVNAKAGETLKVDLFAFNKASSEYIGYEDEDKISQDKRLAAAVDIQIEDIYKTVQDFNGTGSALSDLGKKIKQIKEAYNALTTEQRFYVVNYDKLIACENRYYDLYMSSDNAVMDAIPEQFIIDFMNGNPNSLIEINLNVGALISQELLAAAKNQNCDLKICVYGKKTDKLVYSILIRSDDMSDTINQYDPAVYTEKLDITDSAMESLKKLTGGSNYGSIFGLNRGNKLTANMSVSLNTEESLFNTSADTVYAYYYDEANGAIKLLTSGKNVNESITSFTAGSGGIYLLSDKPLNRETNSIVPTGESGRVYLVLAIQIFSAGMLLILAAALIIKKRKGE